MREHASARMCRAGIIGSLVHTKRSPGSLEWKSRDRASQAWSGAEPYHQDLRFFSVFWAAFCSPRGPSTITTRLQAQASAHIQQKRTYDFIKPSPKGPENYPDWARGVVWPPPPTPQEAVPVARRWNVWSELTLRSHVNHRVGKQFNLSVSMCLGMLGANGEGTSDSPPEEGMVWVGKRRLGNMSQKRCRLGPGYEKPWTPCREPPNSEERSC